MLTQSVQQLILESPSTACTVNRQHLYSAKCTHKWKYVEPKTSNILMQYPYGYVSHATGKAIEQKMTLEKGVIWWVQGSLLIHKCWVLSSKYLQIWPIIRLKRNLNLSLVCFKAKRCKNSHHWVWSTIDHTNLDSDFEWHPIFHRKLYLKDSQHWTCL